jgi:hypothetical protein
MSMMLINGAENDSIDNYETEHHLRKIMTETN